MQSDRSECVFLRRTEGTAVSLLPVRPRMRGFATLAFPTLTEFLYVVTHD